jgi:three-Cys-motif partner protein
MSKGPRWRVGHSRFSTRLILKKLIGSDFPSLQERIRVECEDANVFLMEYCRLTKWEKKRAVMFLDSFGTVVDWETLKAIADTKGADLLYMFPLGIAVTRMLRRKDEIGPTAKKTLTRLFGTSDWFKDLVKTTIRRGFFSRKEITWRQQGCDAIIKYFLGRLKTIFPHVARLKLRNSKGLPMYLLCFASPSQERTEIAKKIFRLGCPRSGLRLSPLVDCR